MKKTRVNLPSYNFKLKEDCKIFAIGSCFSLEVAHFLERSGLSVVSNPFGTIYNSYSIYKVLQTIYDGNLLDDKIYFEDGVYFTLYHSTKFNDRDFDNIKFKIDENLKFYNEKLLQSNIFILTLGTSVVYRYKKYGEIVANCHKFGPDLFSKEILDVSENIRYLNQIIDIIKRIDINNKIIFTLSPVRHTPQNLAENSFSKAILRVAIQSVVNGDDIVYFPSYELVFDELRDYRHYKDDGLHLKKITTYKIMDKFAKAIFSDGLATFLEKLNKIKKMVKHRPFNPTSLDYFYLLKKIFIDIFNLQTLRDDKPKLYLEKLQFITFLRIVKNFSNIYDLGFIYDKAISDSLKLFFDAVIKLEKKESFDIGQLEYQNSFIPKLDMIKRDILLKYYIHSGDVDNAKILLNKKS